MNWKEYNLIDGEPRIVWRIERYSDPIDGGEFEDYHFKIYKRPFWFGFMRPKRWEFACQTNDFKRGLSFCKYLLGDKTQSFINTK